MSQRNLFDGRDLLEAAATASEYKPPPMPPRTGDQWPFSLWCETVHIGFCDHIKEHGCCGHRQDSGLCGGHPLGVRMYCIRVQEALDLIKENRRDSTSKLEDQGYTRIDQCGPNHFFGPGED